MARPSMNDKRREIGEDQSSQDRLFGGSRRRQLQVSDWLRERKGNLFEGNSMCVGLEAAKNTRFSWESENSLTRDVGDGGKYSWISMARLEY